MDETSHVIINPTKGVERLLSCRGVSLFQARLPDHEEPSSSSLNTIIHDHLLPEPQRDCLWLIEQRINHYAGSTLDPQTRPRYPI